MSQENSKTKPMQMFWGVKEVYYGIVQVENLKPLFCTYLSINCHQIVERKFTSMRKALCDVAFVTRSS